MKQIADSFAEQLLAVKAIKLQPNDPFTWASGWKSPIYTDNRKTLAYPELRSFVKNELVHLVHTEFPEATAVAGVATGAIAQGALVADQLQLPYCYVRPKPKDHGMGNQIEGTIPEGAKVVVIEDLISTVKADGIVVVVDRDVWKGLQSGHKDIVGEELVEEGDNVNVTGGFC